MNGASERDDWRDGDAVVGFVDRSEISWLRWLKRGFRHCYVIVRTGDFWVLFDPLSHQTVIHAFAVDPRMDVVGWLKGHGHRVVVTHVRAAPRRVAPIRPHTCVEAVKRVLGIQAWWIVTPWHLNRYLARGPNSMMKPKARDAIGGGDGRVPGGGPRQDAEATSQRGDA